ncbi:hypothetical protein DFH09DRAFT_301029 [Mycena vulgaris]|nr:hypothetical protein DFH09DRAFT_301029 [Mycena vulgaris]
MLFHFLFSVLALFFWFLNTQAVLVNVTIDDTAGDLLTGEQVVYAPPDAWNSGPPCTACAVDPDRTKLGGGTWHDSTFSVNADGGNRHPNVPLTATVKFNGSAVYVFCARSRSNTAPDGNSDMTFYLDGVQVDAFQEVPIGSAGFDYGVLVYSNLAVPPGPHTLTVQNGHQNGPRSLLILDSIVYSYDDAVPEPVTAPPPASAAHKSTRPSGATLAVAGVLVFALLVTLVALGVFLHRRRRRRRAVYARYLPNGAVQAFPSFLAPTRPGTPASITPLPRAHSGGGGGGGNWWVGRDQKTGSHRPYADLDPSQAGLQRPQGWERTV